MTEEYIAKFKKDHQSHKVTYKLIDDDLIFTGGKFNGMKLSEVYIIFPEYIDNLINSDYAEKAVKLIAKTIKEAGEAN